MWRGAFAGKLGELGWSLPPLPGSMACPAAFPSWIMRLNPVLVRCHGPDRRFGLVYQEKPGGIRLPSGEGRSCSHRSHPGCGHCSCCGRGDGAASWWMARVMGTTRNKSLLSLSFFCVFVALDSKGWVGNGARRAFFCHQNGRCKSPPTSGGFCCLRCYGASPDKIKYKLG